MSWIGCIDGINGACVSGWAADDGKIETPVHVDILVNAQRVARVTCDIFREDLLAAGIGDGRKSFVFDPGPYWLAGRNCLEVRYAGTETMVSQGRGYWVKRRGGIADPDAALLAVLEAYREFRPEDRVCLEDGDAGRWEKVLCNAGVVVRQVRAKAAEPADVLVAEFERGVLKSLICQVKEGGVLAVSAREGPRTAEEMRQAFEACGLADFKLESIVSQPDGTRRLFAMATVGDEESRTSAEPALVHIHVPKCAGTSFRVMLEAAFGSRHVGLYVNDTYFVYDEADLRSYVRQEARLHGFSSHHVRTFPQWLGGRRMLYVTFLRDPIQQFISYMTHIQKHYGTITSQSLLEAVPANAPQLTQREFARWLLTSRRDIPFRENHNVNFFTRHSAPDAADRLAAAKAQLSEFFFVGITERMEESVQKLASLARESGVEFPSGHIPFANTSADYRGDLGWIRADDEVGALLLRSVEQDRQLYDWAAARL